MTSQQENLILIQDVEADKLLMDPIRKVALKYTYSNAQKSLRYYTVFHSFRYLVLEGGKEGFVSLRGFYSLPRFNLSLNSATMFRAIAIKSQSGGERKTKRRKESMSPNS